MKKVKVYVATHCQPCEEVKRLLEKGHFSINGIEGEVDLIDVETEEGFKQIFEGMDAVPAAYSDGKRCKISIDEEGETLILECPSESANPGA
jgi:glutaredoxin